MFSLERAKTRLCPVVCSLLTVPVRQAVSRKQLHNSFVRLVFAAILLSFLASAQSAFAQGTGYWHTSGSQILDSNGKVVRLGGVNWYGFETTDAIIHGLWAQDYHTILNEIKSNGYNVIRIPFSNQMVESNPVPTNFSMNNGTPINTDLQGLTSLQILDKIITAAGQIGLRVILDNHRSEEGNSNEASGLWYTSAFPESAWIADWQTLATRYSGSAFTVNGNPTVIGMDLRNEPHLSPNNAGSCWTGDTTTNGCPLTNTAQNWPGAATRAGNAILAINPNLLIFVEGVDCYSGQCDWQGGNLIGVGSNPITLSVPNQLVYSAHDYGPALFAQPWFNSTTTTATLSGVWNLYWNFIAQNGTAPVWLGEFGTGNNATDLQNSAAGSEGQWFQTLVAFLNANPSINWTYWALNGEDSFALLNNSYSGIDNPTKQSMLATNQFPLVGGGTTQPDFSLSANPASVSVAQGGTATSTITVSPTGGFTGTVTLSAGTPPSGVAVAISGTTVAFSAASTATLGSSTITITGTSGTLSHTTTITLTVTAVQTPNFSLTGTNATVTQGGTGASTITVSPTGGFTGSVALSASGLPSGVTASFNPASATTTSTLTFTGSATATTGTATVTITGTSGTLSHTVTITLTVNPATTTTGTGGVTVTPVINSNSAFFDDEGVKISNTAPITALSITITVANTGGLSFSGQYNTVGGSITQSHSSTTTTITYQFALSTGQTLSAGTGWLFDAQMGGTGTAHPVTGDTFSVTYTTGGQTFTQTGQF